MNIFLSILIYLLFGVTTLKAQEIYKSKIINGKGTGYPLIIKVYKDKYENINVCLYDKQNYLYSTSGVGNSNLLDTITNTFIKEVEFIKNNHKEFYIETYDVSSTFGANTFFIIWFDGFLWNITKSPFVKSTLETNEGLSRIIEQTKSSHRVFSYKKKQFCISDK